MKFSINAKYDDDTVRVYQAFGSNIAVPALQNKKFVEPFKMARTTWIKPSFNWMMYRSGYASKPDQSHILAIEIKRQGFEWALKNGVLTSYMPQLYKSRDLWEKALAVKPVRLQWDPERDARMNVLKGSRTVQIGLAGEAVEKYVNDWVVDIFDVTDIALSIKADINYSPHPALYERPYPLPRDFKNINFV